MSSNMVARRNGHTKQNGSGESPRKRVPERTRETLIAAASELFLEQGLDGPSLDLICERAGYTRGAFYVHFETRDALVSAVVETALKDFLDAMVGEGQSDLFSVIALFVDEVEHKRFPIAGRVRVSQVLEACSRSWELRVKFLALLVSARERIAEVVRRSQAQGQVRTDVRAEPLAEMMIALVLGLQVATQLETPYDLRGVDEQVRKLLTPRADAAALREDVAETGERGAPEPAAVIREPRRRKR